MFEWLNSFSSRSWPTFTTEQPCCKHPLKESTLSWWQRVVFFPWQEIKGEGRGDPKSAKHLHCGELVLWPSIRCEGVGEARSKKKKNAWILISEHSVTCSKSNQTLAKLAARGNPEDSPRFSLSPSSAALYVWASCRPFLSIISKRRCFDYIIRWLLLPVCDCFWCVHTAVNLGIRILSESEGHKELFSSTDLGNETHDFTWLIK